LKAVVAFIAAPMIVGAFADDPRVIEMGISYIRLIVPALLVMGPLHVIAAVFKGAGHTVPHMVSALAANWLIKLPLALLLSLYLNMDTNGVWLAITVSIFAELGILFLWFRKREWLYAENIVQYQDQVKTGSIGAGNV